MFDPNVSIFFSHDQISVANEILALYDNYQSTASKKSVPEILQEVYNPDDQAAEMKLARPPNLYLGSIVYYSPANWSVRLNGKRINASDNAATNRYYVSKISRRELELIWRPFSIDTIATVWDQMTATGKKPANVSVDKDAGVIKLFMQPNQTFVVETLSIREGLVK